MLKRLKPFDDQTAIRTAKWFVDLKKSMIFENPAFLDFYNCLPHTIKSIHIKTEAASQLGLTYTSPTQARLFTTSFKFLTFRHRVNDKTSTDGTKPTVHKGLVQSACSAKISEKTQIHTPHAYAKDKHFEKTPQCHMNTEYS